MLFYRHMLQLISLLWSCKFKISLYDWCMGVMQLLSTLRKWLFLQKQTLKLSISSLSFPNFKILYLKWQILPILNLYRVKRLLGAHFLFYSFEISSATFVLLTTSQSIIFITLPIFSSSAGHRRMTYQEALQWSNIPVNLKKLTPSTAMKETKAASLMLKQLALAPLLAQAWAFDSLAIAHLDPVIKFAGNELIFLVFFYKQ